MHAADNGDKDMLLLPGRPWRWVVRDFPASCLVLSLGPKWVFYERQAVFGLTLWKRMRAAARWVHYVFLHLREVKGHDHWHSGDLCVQFNSWRPGEVLPSGLLGLLEKTG
jgi:hypothetical protein